MLTFSESLRAVLHLHCTGMGRRQVHPARDSVHVDFRHIGEISLDVWHYVSI